MGGAPLRAAEFFEQHFRLFGIDGIEAFSEPTAPADPTANGPCTWS